MELDDFRKSPLLQSSRGSYTFPALALPATPLWTCHRGTIASNHSPTTSEYPPRPTVLKSIGHFLFHRKEVQPKTPVPHLEIRIVQRSKGSSAVAGAAYQAGEKLFSEYDQKSKDHRRKQPEFLYTEIMFPANAPPEYADRATLWNAVKEVEKQWNSQLARRFILALPREVPTKMYPQMMQGYCQEHFVSKGMCCDFALHDPDPPGHNPHYHVMLTMRAIDENGKWLPKSRKVYDLDENGERIKLPSGRWKSRHFKGKI